MEESPGRAGSNCLAGQGIHLYFLKPEDFLRHKRRHMDCILSQLKSLDSLTSHFQFHLHLGLQSVYLCRSSEENRVHLLLCKTIGMVMSLLTSQGVQTKQKYSSTYS